LDLFADESADRPIVSALRAEGYSKKASGLFGAGLDQSSNSPHAQGM
jgi:hypothetical protein